MKPIVSTPRNTIIDQKPNSADLLERHRPGEQEGHLEVEDDEQDRHQVEAHVELHARVVEGVEAALVGGNLLGVGIAHGHQERRHHQRQPDGQRHADEHGERQIVHEQLVHAVASPRRGAAATAYVLAVIAAPGRAQPLAASHVRADPTAKQPRHGCGLAHVPGIDTNGAYAAPAMGCRAMGNLGLRGIREQKKCVSAALASCRATERGHATDRAVLPSLRRDWRHWHCFTSFGATTRIVPNLGLIRTCRCRRSR